MIRLTRVKKQDFPEILNQDQASRFLGISRSTLKRHFLSGLIPGKLIGNRYLFSKEALLHWLENDLEPNNKNNYDSSANVLQDTMEEN